MSVIRVFVFHQCTKSEVRRALNSGDMTHFRSQHSSTSLSWPLSWKLVRIIVRGVGNLRNFGVSRTFRTRLIGQHLSDVSCHLASLTFDRGGHGACLCYGTSYASVCQVWSSLGLSFRKIWRTSSLSINRPGDLDLWSWKWCALLTTFLSILVFLERFVLD